MARPKKSVLNTAHQTHGMVENKNFSPTTIDQVLGDSGHSTYGFLKDPFSEDQYSSHLKTLVDSDLRVHCERFGIIFVDNRKMVEGKLLALFRENRAKYRMPTNSTPKSNNNPDFNVINNIMAGGR